MEKKVKKKKRKKEGREPLIGMFGPSQERSVPLPDVHRRAGDNKNAKGHEHEGQLEGW